MKKSRLFAKSKKWRPSDENNLSAIIVCKGPGNIGEPFKKYHNIPDNNISSFLLFAAKFPGAEYVNFYHKKRPGESKGVFKERIYLQ